MNIKTVLLVLVLIPSFAWSAKPHKKQSEQKAPALVADMRMPDSYVTMMAQQIYFWAWPMMNVYNRRQASEKIPDSGLLGGIAPVAPPNKMAMLTDYIEPEERIAACPNQDVVYGVGTMALDKSPVVIQVPDFEKRFWVYQLVDIRTDSFADIGKMYGTKPGFYMVVGPNWKGATPKGITKVLHSPTNTALFLPRVFQDDTSEDKEAIQPVLRHINMYAVADYDGKVKTREWSKLPEIPNEAQQKDQKAETQWVVPEKFFDELAGLLNSTPPLPGEELTYKQARALLQSAARDPHVKEVLKQAAIDAEANLVQPVKQFHNFGQKVPYFWTTISNGAAFGTDYFTRTAVAKSNIFVNTNKETKYFYQDLDIEGQRLNGKNSYTLSFPKGALPPVKGFWSLTAYDENHFFIPNELKRYSVGTKNKDLKFGEDGSLTIYVQAEPPKDEDLRSNWLPIQKNQDFSLYVRAYWPKEEILSGSWSPPALLKTPTSNKISRAD